MNNLVKHIQTLEFQVNEEKEMNKKLKVEFTLYK